MDVKLNREAVFDVMKLILVLMVAAIHCTLYPQILYPWLRLAVPLFFITSSYFFFKKQSMLLPEQKMEHLKKYVKRNVMLYLFWFIAILPYTLHLRNYFSAGVWMGIVRIVKALLFSSTFPASWFLQALTVAVVTVFFCSKKVNNTLLLCIAGIIYSITVIRSSYWSEFQSIPLLLRVSQFYEMIFSEPMFNASSAFIWIVLGKCFAEQSFKMRTSSAVWGTVVSCALLYVEWRLVKQLNETYNNDCYFFLMPTAFFIFAIVKNIHIPVRKMTTFMAKSSVIIYTTHMPIIAMLRAASKRLFGFENNLIVYLTTLCVCVLGSLVILKLEKYRCFKWLKYSH